MHTQPESGYPIDRITTDTAPAAGGHYSQAVVHNNVVYVSGQLPTVPGSTDRTVKSIGEQTRQALRNVDAILRAAGSGLDHALSMTIYISDMSLWTDVNAVYADVMGDAKPARAIVPVGPLHYGYQIEIQAVGAVGRRH